MNPVFLRERLNDPRHGIIQEMLSPKPQKGQSFVIYAIIILLIIGFVIVMVWTFDLGVNVLFGCPTPITTPGMEWGDLIGCIWKGG